MLDLLHSQIYSLGFFSSKQFHSTVKSPSSDLHAVLPILSEPDLVWSLDVAAVRET